MCSSTVINAIAKHGSDHDRMALLHLEVVPLFWHNARDDLVRSGWKEKSGRPAFFPFLWRLVTTILKLNKFKGLFFRICFQKRVQSVCLSWCLQVNTEDEEQPVLKVVRGAVMCEWNRRTTIYIQEVIVHVLRPWSILINSLSVILIIVPRPFFQQRYPPTVVTFIQRKRNKCASDSPPWCVDHNKYAHRTHVLYSPKPELQVIMAL